MVIKARSMQSNGQQMQKKNAGLSLGGGGGQRAVVNEKEFTGGPKRVRQSAFRAADMARASLSADEAGK